MGLGSRAYPNFCNFGKFLDKSLSSLGGKRLVEVGLCDDQSKPENSFKAWMTKVQEALGYSKDDIPEQEPLVATSSTGMKLRAKEL